MPDHAPPAPLPLPLPADPVLRPGTPVARYDGRWLRVGLDPPRRALVEDHPDVRRLLTALRSRAPLPPPSAAGDGLLRRLLAADLVVDGTLLREPPPGWPPETVAALVAGSPVPSDARGAPAGAAERVDRRARARIGVLAPTDLDATCSQLLGSCGVRVVPVPARGAGCCSVVLVVADGEPRRARLDRLQRLDVPHLVVSLGADRARVGPFVVPGLTACQRCVDAHLTADDPGRALVLEQPGGPTGEVPARDPALAATAVGHAAGELLAFVDGDRPCTWSATVSWGATDLPVRTGWSRHPHCGCTWGDDLAG